MNNIAIGTRLGLAFAAMLLITALIATVGVWRLGTLQQVTVDLATTDMARSTLAQRWKADINLNWQRASAALKTSDASYIEALQNEMTQTSKGISDKQKTLESLLQDGTGQKLLAEVARTRNIYVQARAGLLATKKTGQDAILLV